MDLITLMQICQNTNETERELFTREHDIDIKTHELSTLKNLINCFINNCKISNDELSFYTDYFWIGFKIPQIGEEFDLLRFGKNYNINIELKSDNIPEKMKKQLLRKKHYLKFLSIPTYHFIFSSENDCLYKLDENNEITSIAFEKLYSIIQCQDINKKNKNEIQKLFNASNYLISPFNNTDNFLQNNYFLTNHQQLIKNKLFRNIEKKDLFFMIEGAAGTGKTLLVYDFVKNCIEESMTPLIIHTGNLNSGHLQLNNTSGWNISSIKNALNNLNNELDIIIVDESQRLETNQFRGITDFCKKNGIPCVFSLDENQCLHTAEINREMRTNIAKITERENQHRLKEKIRSNKELADFIKLFNKIPLNNSPKLQNENRNIKIKYFDTKPEAERFVALQKQCGWKHLTYSNSRFTPEKLDKLVSSGEDTPHKVIGQEFDKVVVMLDDNFYYEPNETNTSLVLNGTKETYYHTTKMLFQNMTRSRNELTLAIIDNPNMLINLTNILVNF